MMNCNNLFEKRRNMAATKYAASEIFSEEPYRIAGVESVMTPTLAIYPEIVDANIDYLSPGGDWYRADETHHAHGNDNCAAVTGIFHLFLLLSCCRFTCWMRSRRRRNPYSPPTTSATSRGLGRTFVS